MFQNNLLMGAAAAASGGGTSLVSVGNSALFSAVNQSLSRTQVAGSNTVWTFSSWIYKCESKNQVFLNSGSSPEGQLGWNASDQFYIYNGSTTVGLTTQLFRDIGWYHIHLAYNTGGSGTNKVQLSVNGKLVTAWATDNRASAGAFNNMNQNAQVLKLGNNGDDTGTVCLNGYMAETVILDGTAASVTSFGAYDSSGLFWTPLATETIQELTFGTNGFYLSNTTDLSSNMTTFVDSGPTAHTITTIGNTTHSPLGQKVQNSVIYSDGSGDGFKLAQSGHADFTFGTGDFCIEGWFNRTALSGTSNYSYVFDFRYAGNDTGRPACYMDGSNNISYDVGGSNKIISTTDPSLGAWFHLAIARNSSTTTMYLNGTSVGSFSDSTDYLVGRPWYFEYPQSNSYCFKGYGTEIRVSKGVPRYTGNFTPSTTAFVSDSNTSLLIHSDKFFGVANDDSGKYNHRTNNNTVTKSTHTPTNLKPLLNQLNSSATTTLSNGNQSFVNSAANNIAFGTIPLPSTGKWYFEYKLNNASSSSIVHLIGLMKLGDAAGWNSGISSGFSDFSSCYLAAAQQIWQDGSLLNSPSTGAGSINDILSLAVDLDNTKMWIGYNNSFYNASGGTDGNPATGANAMSTKNFSDNYGIITGLFSSQGTIQFDTDDFSYTPPSGFLALNSTNLKSTTTRTASDTTKYFDTILYEGNGDGQRVGQFQPFGNAFTVAKSALFDDANSESLTRAFSTPSSANVWTFSTWLKRSALSTGVVVVFGGTYNRDLLLWNGGDNLHTMQNGVTGIDFGQTLEDSSQWFHVVWSQNGTTTIGYINGVQVATDTETNDTINESGITHYIGNRATSAAPYDGYMAETVFIDGSALTPSSFGQTDTSTNRWIPKDVSGLTFGNNGFYLNYANSSDVGNDVSGNNNDWTNNNTVLQSTDSPTTNWAVLNPSYDFSNGTFSNGNRNIVTGSSQYGPALGTLGVNSGKFYWEIKPTADTAGTLFCLIGISRGLNLSTTNNLGVQVGDYGYYSYGSGSSTGTLVTNTSGVGDTYGASYTIDDIMGVALDLDSKTLTFYKNNSSQGVITGLMDGMYYPAMGDWNNSGSTTFEVRFDSSLWSYSAPTGHSALSQDNITSSDQFITAFSWIKNRDATDNHMLFDRVRGATKDMHSNDTAAEVTNTNTLQSFLAGGVQVGNNVEVNTANESYVLWNFMMEATGSGSSLTSGSINTTALVDTTLGMSVGTFTGTGSANETIETGLTGCEMIIVKRTNATYGWAVWHSGLTDDYSLLLNTSATQVSSGYWDTSGNTSTLIELGTDSEAVNKSGQPYNFIAFAPSQFIRIGSYTNNNNANGPFVPTVNSLGIPIQPTWIIAKTLASASWMIFDNKRIGYNVDNNNLLADTTVVENTADKIDIVTGGFKLRTNLDPNYSTSTTVYMAIGTPIIDTSGRIIAGR